MVFSQPSMGAGHRVVASVALGLEAEKEKTCLQAYLEGIYSHAA
jgi:hypothetical protein